MKKEDFKKKVLAWLAENKIYPKRVRVYNSRRYGLEVRLYNEPMEMPNMRKSRRMLKNPTDEYNSTFGIHSQTISTYTHINEKDFASDNEEERNFILDTIRNS